MRTREIAAQIEQFNRKLVTEDRKYILIGPGRWGTRDPFIGIPVNWSQISNAKVIVETSLEDFPLDASLGSHFFHNVTSMNVGYFSIQHDSSTSFIQWDELKQQELVEETEFVKHIRFKEPVCIMMDGKKRISIILEACLREITRVTESTYPTIDFSHTAFNLLMQKRIRTVLIISSNYDFFMLEEDGRIDEQIFNEYVSLNLRYPLYLSKPPVRRRPSGSWKRRTLTW